MPTMTRFALAMLLCVGCRAPALGPEFVYGELGTRTGLSVDPPAHERDPVPAGWIPGDELSQDAAVAVALRNSPDYAALLEDLGIAKADWWQAGLLRNPDASLLLRFFIPGFGFQDNFALGLPIELGGQLPIRRRIAELNWQRVAHRLVHGGMQLVTDVRSAHAELCVLQLKQQLTRDAEATLVAASDIARKRYEAGDTGVQELSLSLAELARVRLDGARLDRDRAVAGERLERLMGTTGRAWAWSVPTEVPQQPTSESCERLCELAIANRPDVQSADRDAEAGASKVHLQWVNVIPTIILGVAQQSQTGAPTQFGPMFAMPLPVFDQNLAQISRADAELRKVIWTAVAARLQAVSEVRTAWHQRQRTQAVLDRFCTDLIPKLEDAVRVSEKAFELGQESFLTVLLARRGLIDARLQEADAQLQLVRAVYELDRAVGGRPQPEVSR